MRFSTSSSIHMVCFAWAMAFLVLLPAIIWISSARAQEESILRVLLTIREGYVQIDQEQTTLALTSDFRRLCSLSESEIKKELTEYLDQLFRKRGRLVDQLLTEDSKLKREHGLLNEQSLEPWNRITRKWDSDFILEFQVWITANHDLVSGDVKGIYQGMIAKGGLEADYQDGPLDPIQSNDWDGNEEAFMLGGKIEFRLAGPVTPGCVSSSSIRFTTNIDESGDWSRDIKKKHLSAPLSPLVGGLWYRTKIRRELEDYLELRGIRVADYQGTVEPGSCAGVFPEKPVLKPSGSIENDRIKISPDPLLAGVIVRVPPEDEETLRLALYMILPSEDFDLVSERMPAYIDRMNDVYAKEEGRIAYMSHLSLTSPPGSSLLLASQYLTNRVLAECSRSLETAGFFSQTINETTDRPRRLKTVELLISPSGKQPAASSAGETRKTPVPDPSAAESQVLEDLKYERSRNYALPASFEKTASREDERFTDISYRPDLPNYLRLGVEYSPRQDFRYLLAYTRTGLTGPDAVLAEVGFQEQIIGRAAYSRDFLLFDSLQRRLQLRIAGFSDFEPDRFLAGEEVDERRTGGSIEASIDLLRNLQGLELRLDLVGSFLRSSLEQQKHTFEHENLSTVDLGLLHLKRWDGTPGSARIEFQPLVRLGYGDQEGVWYFKPSLRATYHRFVSSFLQWECNAGFAWASEDTPSVELPSFGGESSVRGYRKDAGVGRVSWAVQNELWVPVRFPLGLPLPEEFDKIVRRNLAVAAFFDLGGIHQSTDGFSGVKTGGGMGLRFVCGDLTLRLDWAHAIDETDRRRGGSMVYFTVTALQGL